MVDIVRDIGAAPVRIYRTKHAATVPPVQEEAPTASWTSDALLALIDHENIDCTSAT